MSSLRYSLGIHDFLWRRRNPCSIKEQAGSQSKLHYRCVDWSGLMSAAKQLNFVLDVLKWISDFRIDTDPSYNVFYIQEYFVGSTTSPKIQDNIYQTKNMGQCLL